MKQFQIIGISFVVLYLAACNNEPPYSLNASQQDALAKMLAREHNISYLPIHRNAKEEHVVIYEFRLWDYDQSTSLLISYFADIMYRDDDPAEEVIALEHDRFYTSGYERSKLIVHFPFSHLKANASFNFYPNDPMNNQPNNPANFDDNMIIGWRLGDVLWNERKLVLGIEDFVYEDGKLDFGRGQWSHEIERNDVVRVYMTVIPGSHFERDNILGWGQDLNGFLEKNGLSKEPWKDIL